MVRYFLGVDLGQAADFTALAAVERVEAPGEWDAATYARLPKIEMHVRYLERTALGTPYPEIVERVAEVARSHKLAGQSQIVVDATGVGRPVVDLLKMAAPECWIVPAVITGGERESLEGGYWRVPKRDLVVGLQVLFQSKGLRIAAGLQIATTLGDELAEMKVKVTGAGREQYGVWRQGKHDDLVLAVALACWGARRMYPGAPGARARQGRIV